MRRSCLSDSIADHISLHSFTFHRLSSILAKRNLSEKKLDELKVKANILKSFTDKPKEKKEDETVSREKAEL